MSQEKPKLLRLSRNTGRVEVRCTLVVIAGSFEDELLNESALRKETIRFLGGLWRVLDTQRCSSLAASIAYSYELVKLWPERRKT